MAIKMRENETIRLEVNFHWSAFIAAKIWAAFGVIYLIGSVAAAISKPLIPGEGAFNFFMTLLFFGPITYKWVQNKAKKYIVTNQRLYLETGVLTKSKNDIPLNKINDISLKQGILQRILGSGDVVILTGNDNPTVIKDIEHPDEFKNAISEMMEKRSI